MSNREGKTLKEIAGETRYPVGAFEFVRKGLDYTVRRIHREPEKLEEGERHVSGQQLCEGLRRYALKQYGFLARTVLRRWRLNQTEDFGEIVFAMVNGGLMQMSEGDSIHDFGSGFDFDKLFDVEIPVGKVPLTDPLSL